MSDTRCSSELQFAVLTSSNNDKLECAATESGEKYDWGIAAGAAMPHLGY